MAKHWAAELGEKIIARRGTNHVVSIGVSPSGPIHVGFLREIVIGDVIRRTLTQMGANAKLVLTSDDMDPLRHVYPFLPTSYSDHVGKPLCRIPDPEGCCPNYAEHFIRPLEKAFAGLGVEIEVRRSSVQYDLGTFTEVVKLSLEQRDQIVEIIKEESGRELGEDWASYNAICATCGRLTTTSVQESDTANHRIRYKCQNGHDGWADYSKAEGKLPWRIDWAARWHAYGVTVEPFGKDHAGAGGSYDTGSRFSREVFHSDPPEPIPYEWIELRGMGPMSSSKGVVITISDILEAVPAQIMRYLLVRTRASKHITFDPCVGLLQLWDEYEKIAQAIQSGDDASVTDIDRANYEYADVPGADNPATLGISFKHLTTAVQLAGDSESVLRESLLRSGYRDQCQDWDRVRLKAQYAQVWVQRFASEDMRLSLAESLPESVQTLSDQQRKLLAHLLEYLKSDRTDMEIHNEIYEEAERLGLRSKEAFGAVYRVFLGASRGPRVGWFLRALDPEFVRKRLEDALAATGMS